MIGDTKNFGGILLVHLTFGLTLAALTYVFIYISSAHFNPAMTFGLALAQRFPWRYVLPFWLVQCAGALLAISCHALFLPEHARLAQFGATIPKVTLWAALGIEIILSILRMLVKMGSTTDKRFNRADGGLTVGFTMIACGLMGNSLSGASMNPARSLAPALFAGGHALTSLWLYIVGPLCGAAIGALLYEFMRGGEEYATPALDDLPVQVKKPWFVSSRKNEM